MTLLSSADVFQSQLSKYNFRNTSRVLNGVDPDQDRPSVGPDQDPGCLQRLSADVKCRR